MKEVHLTESAKLALDRAQQAHGEEIINYLKRNRFVAGIDIVEITAADISLAEEQMKVIFIDRNERRIKNYQIIGMLYGVIGAMMSIFAVFYESLLNIFIENPIRAYLFIFGLILAVAGIIVNRYIKEQIYREILRSRNEHIK